MNLLPPSQARVHYLGKRRTRMSGEISEQPQFERMDMCQIPTIRETELVRSVFFIQHLKPMIRQKRRGQMRAHKTLNSYPMFIIRDSTSEPGAVAVSVPCGVGSSQADILNEPNPRNER